MVLFHGARVASKRRLFCNMLIREEYSESNILGFEHFLSLESRYRKGLWTFKIWEPQSVMFFPFFLFKGKVNFSHQRFLKFFKEGPVWFCSHSDNSSLPTSLSWLFMVDQIVNIIQSSSTLESKSQWRGAISTKPFRLELVVYS